MIDRFPPYVLIALGGMFGALARYWISGLLKNVGSIPLGTLTVNILGSLLLAFILTLYTFNYFGSYWVILLGTGFMGSFTTMSTFVVESLNLADINYQLIFMNIVITLTLVFLSGIFGRFFAMSYIQWNGVI